MYVTLQIKKETKNRLARFGTLSSTYDSVINELITNVENCRCKVNKI